MVICVCADQVTQTRDNTAPTKIAGSRPHLMTAYLRVCTESDYVNWRTGMSTGSCGIEQLVSMVNKKQLHSFTEMTVFGGLYQYGLANSRRALAVAAVT